MKIKICGLTRIEDIVELNAYPAWAAGFNFYPASPRYVSAALATDLIKHLSPTILKVGVFVNQDSKLIVETCQRCALDLVQLHGDESPAVCRSLPVPVIKAFRIRDAASIDAIQPYQDAVAYVLLDGFSPVLYGGSGQLIPPELLTGFYHPQWILAGGIDAKNARALWQSQQPFALDVCSSVESEPGIKSSEKLKALFAA